MGKERPRREPEITAAIISVVGTLVGTLLIGVLLGFMEGRIGLGPVVAVITLLLVLSIWVLLAFRWGIRLAAAAAAAMVIVGSVLFLIVTAAQIIPFGVPSATPVAAAASPTREPTTTLTPTPLPPAPPSSSADEARAFAEPILAAIADRPPDLEDDFSDPGSGWEIGMHDTGEMGYKEGEYFVISRGPDAGDWAGTPEFSDFVLEVDVWFVSGETGSWMLIFRRCEGSLDQPSPGFYGIYGSPSGDLFLRKFISGDPAEGLLTPAPVLKPGYGTNHLMVIGKGHQIALYVNGEPVGLGHDESFNRGTIGLTAGTDSDTPLEVHFDSLKVWDISDLSK